MIPVWILTLSLSAPATLPGPCLEGSVQEQRGPVLDYTAPPPFPVLGERLVVWKCQGNAFVKAREEIR